MENPIENQIESPKTTTAYKIAAAYLMINAFFVLMGIVLGIEDSSKLTMLLTSSVIDLVIGVSILMNRSKWILYAKIRVILGLVAYSSIAVASKDYWTLGVQVVLSLSILLVLMGSAGKARRIVSIVFFSLVFLIYAEGTISASTGRSVIGGWRLTREYSLVDIDRGGDFDIPEMTKNWKMRLPDSYVLENQYVDLWLVNPYRDAHIMIIYESFDSPHGVEHSVFVDNVLSNAEAVASVEVLYDETDEYGGFSRTKMETRSILSDIPFRYNYSIMSSDRDIIQIICFTFDKNFKYSEADFKSFIDRFALK